MLVQGEKSSPLISIIFRKRQVKKKLPFPQVLKTVLLFLFLRSTLSLPSPGLLLFLLLYNSYGLSGRPEPAAQETQEGWGMGGGSEPKLLPLALQLG